MPDEFHFIFEEDHERRVIRKLDRIMRRLLNLEMKFDDAILDSSEASRLSNKLKTASGNLRKAVADNPLPKKTK